MAISETTLKDTVQMLVDEQNKKGGVLGKKIEAVVVDPASNCFPENEDLNILGKIIEGGNSKLVEAGCALVGGLQFQESPFYLSLKS